MTFLESLFSSVLNSENRIDTVQHAHPNNGTFHFKSPSLSGTTAEYIIIDISNTDDYPHLEGNEDFLHLEWLRLHVDSTNNGEYTVELGYLKNVDGTNGDFVSILDVNGSKAIGNEKEMFLNFYPNGHRCKEGFTVGVVDADNASFNTVSNLPSTLDPSTSDTPSGNGDLALKVAVTAGSILVSIEGAYHAHK